MKKLSCALIGAAAFAAATFVSPAGAMPVAGLATVVQDQSADLQNVRWVWVGHCWRCHYWHRSSFWAWHRPIYRPAFFVGWHRPVFWGWRRRLWW